MQYLCFSIYKWVIQNLFIFFHFWSKWVWFELSEMQSERVCPLWLWAREWSNEQLCERGAKILIAPLRSYSLVCDVNHHECTFHRHRIRYLRLIGWSPVLADQAWNRPIPISSRSVAASLLCRYGLMGPTLTFIWPSRLSWTVPSLH